MAKKKAASPKSTKTTEKKGEDPKTEEAIVGAKEASGATENPETTPSTSEPISGPQTEEISEQPEIQTPGMTFAEAEEQMTFGRLVKLPELGGFWFKKHDEDPIYVMTAEGEILDTPHEEYKSRNDWQLTDADAIQEQLLSGFWTKRDQKRVDSENKKILDEHNELKAIYYSRGSGGSFKKVSGTVTVADLLKREKYPSGTNIDSEFVLENGKVFSVKENRVTEKDVSNQLKSLKKQK